MFDDEPDALPCQGKLAFDTAREARAAANVANYQHGSRMYVYRCHYCGLWHLSSQSPED